MQCPHSVRQCPFVNTRFSLCCCRCCCCCCCCFVIFSGAPKASDAKAATADSAATALQLLSFLVRQDKLARVLPVDVVCADGPSVAAVGTAVASKLTAALTTALPPFAAEVALQIGVASPPPAKAADLPEHLLSARWSLQAPTNSGDHRPPAVLYLPSTSLLALPFVC